MDVDEAREKFGNVVEDDGTEKWEPNWNRVRGALLQYARARDCILVGVRCHDPSEYIDDAWDWLQEKLGDGFEGVFQGDEMSPSGRFDRVSKNKLEEISEGLYENNDEYKREIKDALEYDESLDEDDSEDGEGGEVGSIRDMSRHGLVKELYDNVERSFPAYPREDNNPNKGAYKYYMKMFAVNIGGIDTDAESPSADEFVEVWLEYIAERASTVSHIVMTEDTNAPPDAPIPEKEDLAKWCRELWENDDEFRENVVRKWGEECDYSPDESSSSRSMGEITRPQKERDTGGQQDLTDFA